MLTIPEFAERKNLYDWLVANKSLLLTQKKSAIKNADAFSSNTTFILDDGKTEVTKADEIPATASKLKVRSIVNTTKLFDSHMDVHIDQLWNKSILDTKDNFLVKQHDFSWDGIISDNVKVFAKRYTWHELGYNYEGNTQALIYDSILERDEMPDGTKTMFDLYRKGKVKQHSVGMRYKALTFCLNDTRYKEDFESWEKFFPEVANKEDALENGFFWAVTQAQHIEGSAVLRGANFVTPTLHVEAKQEQPKGIPEQSKDILKASDLIQFYNPKI